MTYEEFVEKTKHYGTHNVINVLGRLALAAARTQAENQVRALLTRNDGRELRHIALRAYTNESSFMQELTEELNKLEWACDGCSRIARAGEMAETPTGSCLCAECWAALVRGKVRDGQRLVVGIEELRWEAVE